LGIDLAFLTKVIIQNAPRGYRAVRDALKNMGKNVDEADQAVMKAEMETGMSQTPVQMEMDLAAPKAKPVQNTQEQAYNLETRLYDLNNVIRQEGGVMSKTNFQKINKEINEIQSKLNKLQGYKNGGIVQNSVDYALEQWT
jgi:polyhydroxyalkanoate synthesis regulator phasin